MLGVGPVMMRDVAGQQLGRGAAGQGLEDRGDVAEMGHQLFDADQGDVNLRQRGDQTGVALVGDQDDAAGLGHGHVAAGDAHVRLEKLGPQFLARHLDQARNIGGEALVDFLAENRSDTSSLVMWMAGMTMCEGVCPASWMIHSPRSVSLTSMPAFSR